MNKHGWEAPIDYAHALQLYVQNGNTKLKNAIDLEIEKIKRLSGVQAAYHRGYIINAPKDHQKIRVHFCLMSTITEKSRQGLWLMGTLQMNQMNLFTQELLH